eukprot:15334422-Ditylum_brightwellii.AAC.1
MCALLFPTDIGALGYTAISQSTWAGWPLPTLSAMPASSRPLQCCPPPAASLLPSYSRAITALLLSKPARARASSTGAPSM